jgi:serine/threonine protein kinase
MATVAAPLQQQQPQQQQPAAAPAPAPAAANNAAAVPAQAQAAQPSSSSSSSVSKNQISAPTPEKSGVMHSFMVNACRFLVDVKYSPLKPLGRGAYGVVCSALDKVANRKVAIKKVVNAFDDLIDAKRILREVKMLRHFKHENVIGLRDLIPPPEDEPFNDIYIVLDFMETDLHKIIYSKNELTDEHIQYFLYQILKGMKYIHSANVIHRDLKPSNLLLNSNCDLKICDFGLARGVKEDVDYELTEYVVTRWYRAPEVMCSCQEYDSKIDVWSIGQTRSANFAQQRPPLLAPPRSFLFADTRLFALVSCDVHVRGCFSRLHPRRVARSQAFVPR